MTIQVKFVYSIKFEDLEQTTNAALEDLETRYRCFKLIDIQSNISGGYGYVCIVYDVEEKNENES